MTPVLLIAVALLAAIAIHDAVRAPTLRRLAMRNVARRRGEAALVIVGCLLGAAIITSSFLVGDSLRASVRDVARTDLGPVDEVVQVPVAHLAAADAAVGGELPPGAAALPVVRVAAVGVSTGAARRAEPHLRLVEMDLAAARSLGGDPGATGLAALPDALRPGEVVLEQDAARALGARAGDRVRILAGGGDATMLVRAVVPGVGLAGLGDPAEPESANALVAPGTIARMAVRGARGAQPPVGILLIANGRGVFGGVARTDEVSAAVARALAPVAAVSVQPVKRDLLKEADDVGSSFGAIFGAVGAVAVIAGILLLVNVFVMLADERKVQLGTLRALGLRRLGMVRAFALEGAIYSVVGAALGALVGIGVARIVVDIAGRIFASTEANISIRFAVPGSSVALGFGIGAVISLLAVWATSSRVARLNIIRAIRDQPAPPWRRSIRRIELLSAACLALGVLGTVVGIFGGAWVPALLGPVLAIAGLGGLAAAVVPVRWAVAAAATATLAWGALSVVALPEVFENAGVPGFVAQGVVMCAAGICLASLDSRFWLGVAHRSPGSGLPARLGLAYPLARPFRTAIQMGMFSLVIFGIVFMNMISHLYQEQAPRYVRDIGAGHTVVVDSSPGNPLDAATLARQNGVAAVAPLVRAFPDFSAPRHPEYARWFMTGFDARLLERGTPALGERDPRYGSDREAFEAVLRSPSLAIVPDWFLQSGGGTEAHYAKVGESITMRDPASGRTRRLRVAGIVDADWAQNGVMVSTATARAVLGRDAVASRSLLALRPGADPDALAAELTGRLVDHGADAESLRAVVDRALTTNRSFMALAQGYVALGLLIGIGGLGVVMIRAVRERRRQVGMLRAMGVPAVTVRRAFVLESGFVAARGLLIGGGLALLSCWLLTSRSDALGERGIPFTVPWGTLWAMFAVALLASLAATAVPAARAARIRPAVALRVAE
jgi:putative ABC transport system permease protein